MVERYRDGVVPKAEQDPALIEGEDGFDGLVGRVEALLDGAELSQALGEIWDRVRRLNRYVEETRPWELAKEEGAGDRLDQVLYSLAEGVRVLALLLCAYMPSTSDQLLDAIGESERGLADFGSGSGGGRIERTAPLFPKLEPAAQG